MNHNKYFEIEDDFDDIEENAESHKPPMPLIGILCEKNSARINFCNAFEIDPKISEGETDDYTLRITAASGHLFGLMEPDKLVSIDLADRYKKWDLDYLPWNPDDFQWKYMSIPEKRSLIDPLHNLLSECDEIVIATDNDPSGEGELIAWEILAKLQLTGKKVTRMFFIDETPDEIQRAFKDRQSLPPLDENAILMQAFFRTKFDYLTQQWTRMASLCGGNAVLRQGRLKSAIIALIGDALEKRRKPHEKEMYQLQYKDKFNHVFISDTEPKHEEKVDLEPYEPSEIIVDSKTKRKSIPPKLPDLPELAGVMSAKGIPAETVTTIFQKMYEAQIVSYPRTADNKISPAQFDILKREIPYICAYLKIPTILAANTAPRPEYVSTDVVHGALRPGKWILKSKDELKERISFEKEKEFYDQAAQIYELLLKRSLMIFMDDFRYYKIKAHIKDHPDFTSEIDVPAMTQVTWIDFADGNVLASVDGGKKPDVMNTSTTEFDSEAVCSLEKCEPEKQPQITVAWLMQQLRHYDIGTGATRVSTFADLSTGGKRKKKYQTGKLIVEQNGLCYLSDHGTRSYKLMKGTNLADMSMTESLTQLMRSVSSGKISEDEAFKTLTEYAAQDKKTIIENFHKMQAAGETILQHPLKQYEGVWNGKKVLIKNHFRDHFITQEEAASLFAGKKLKVEIPVAKDGSSEQTYEILIYIGEKQNDKNQTVLSLCWQYPPKDKAEIPATYYGHVFTQSEKEILQSGMPLFINDTKNKKGKYFDVVLQWSEETPGAGYVLKKVPKYSDKIEIETD